MSPDVGGKPVYQLVNFIYINELQSGFSDVLKLIELIETLPTKTASVERSFSALKRLHTYLSVCNSMSE